MTGKNLRKKVCDIINSWLGATKGSPLHQDIVNTYNSFKPLARNYKLQLGDAYCAATVSAAWIKAGIAEYTGTEVGVQKFVKIAQDKNIWVEKDSYIPQIGDVVVYDWEDNGIGDNIGEPNHMGIVTSVGANDFVVTEGNMQGGIVGQQTIKIDGKYIRGFITPDYDLIAKQLNGYAVNEVKGIDISIHNTKSAGRLDWDKIKADGVKFVIIRTGYGKTYADSNFDYDINSAYERGIKVGVYHFSYALDANGVKQEAEYVIKLLKPYKDKIELPVFFDFEGDTVNYAKNHNVILGKNEFNNHTRIFCDLIKKAGYISGTYYNLNYKRNWVDDSQIGEYTQWFAQYNSVPSWDGYDIWQYASNYKIEDINCNFDVNLMSANYWNSLFYKTNNDIEDVVYNNKYYVTLGEVTNKYYRPTLLKLINNDILRGFGGSGDDMEINLSEESIRLLVMLDRAGVFDG